MSEQISDNIYPQFEKMVPRSQREQRLGQRSHVFWLCGLSGSGKTTLSVGLEHTLFAQGYCAQVLDGDNIRSGLNKDLGFSLADREENIRRIAEVARLFAHAGVIVIASFICPTEELRKLAREIIGAENFSEIYIKASYETCAARDPKGLYAKVNRGSVGNFTGKDAVFEEPQTPDLLIDTEAKPVDKCLESLNTYAQSKIGLT